MLISAQDFMNQYYVAPTGATYTPWAFAWTCQKLVSASEVLATGGTED